MERRTKFIAALGVLAVLVSLGGRWAYREYQQRRAMAFVEAILSTPTGPPSWRQYLPVTATDVHEWGQADGFLPDYGYMLKARITAPEFQQFVAQLGLTPHTPERTYSDDSAFLSWSAQPGFPDDWWNPSPALEATFVSQGHDTWTFAKYELGFLYFESLNH